MQRVECYIPMSFIHSNLDPLGEHGGDVITTKDYTSGGGLRLMGPLYQIPGVRIVREIPVSVQRQAAQLGYDPHAIVYHDTREAEDGVHEHLRFAGLARTDNMIRVLQVKPPEPKTRKK